ncbi:hypothetical protein ABW02_24305 [Niallia circulans]|uniref:DUF2332 domain-containing protein n=1 Tax=Niallia circulans TaxID=1397 RepID=A0A0J1HWP4_NIACI|nr:DUF2332 domain-containing protein [Niallia circulans]KLV18114.1 hypothetical protein ABW02_24305 [Niallia circulans]PAD27455.1 DUF2332 domain-containing protein [Niallia circulans]
MQTNEMLTQTFLTFAEKECKGSSFIYELLSKQIAMDKTLLNIAKCAREGQPVPNLLFGAVHYLLLKGTNHSLKDYYPSITENPKTAKASFPIFKDFCLKYQKEIIWILQTKLVQTNEVRRCSYLYPAFCMIYNLAKKPLALIEIGTSAGFQLQWDKYAYSYGKEWYGNSESELPITAIVIGENMPFLLKTSPPVTARIGFDLHTIDLHDKDEELWLKALIWPEHRERLFLFEKAADYRREGALNVVSGDGVSLLPYYAETIPEGSAICIFHTHVANQIPREGKELLLQSVEEIGKHREVFHLYNNIQDRYLHLDYYMAGKKSENTIAETDGHGRWFKWLKNDIK